MNNDDIHHEFGKIIADQAIHHLIPPLSQAMDNDKCCGKCYGRQGTRAGGGIYCLDGDCPCHTPPQVSLKANTLTRACACQQFQQNGTCEHLQNLFPLPQEEPWVSIEGTLYDLARRKATVQETLQLIRKYTTMENRITTPHSDHIGKAADMIEEPWVAELEALKIVVETYESDHGKTTEYYLHNEGKEYDRLKSFIQKTLEADRKERAGVVVERVTEKTTMTRVPGNPWNDGHFAALEDAIDVIKDVMK